MATSLGRGPKLNTLSEEDNEERTGTMEAAAYSHPDTALGSGRTVGRTDGSNL